MPVEAERENENAPGGGGDVPREGKEKYGQAAGTLSFCAGEDMTDVQGDGYCGFRAVALALFGKEDAWPTVRISMATHLRNNKEFYIEQLSKRGSPVNLERFAQETEHAESPAGYGYWFCAPQHMIIAANTFARPFVLLHNDNGFRTSSFTFIPSDFVPGARLIPMMFTPATSHFQVPQLLDNGPLLPVYFGPLCCNFDASFVRQWRGLLGPRLDTWPQRQEQPQPLSHC